jgi:hypothetical protein
MVVAAGVLPINMINAFGSFVIVLKMLGAHRFLSQANVIYF